MKIEEGDVCFTVKYSLWKIVTEYEACNIMYYKGGAVMTLSLRMKEEDSRMIRAYAKMHGMTVSELIRKTMMQHIEDEYDLELYKQAAAAYKEHPETYSLAEVEKEVSDL